MRLWHQALIPHLPRAQLLGQHRECCALRGLGWGKKHATVNYVFEHPLAWLEEYHGLVMHEMCKRSYKVDPKWGISGYRGKNVSGQVHYGYLPLTKRKVYPEHDYVYLEECLNNLAAKGIQLNTFGIVFGYLAETFNNNLHGLSRRVNEMNEKLQKKPINRIARYKTALQMMAAGTRKFKASIKHIEMLHNEEFDKELERLIYEQQKFFRDVGRALRNEEKAK